MLFKIYCVVSTIPFIFIQWNIKKYVINLQKILPKVFSMTNENTKTNDMSLLSFLDVKFKILIHIKSLIIVFYYNN